MIKLCNACATDSWNLCLWDRYSVLTLISTSTLLRPTKLQVINLNLINLKQKKSSLLRECARSVYGKFINCFEIIQIRFALHTVAEQWLDISAEIFASATGYRHLISVLTLCGARLSQSGAICVATDFQIPINKQLYRRESWNRKQQICLPNIFILRFS